MFAFASVLKARAVANYAAFGLYNAIIYAPFGLTWVLVYFFPLLLARWFVVPVLGRVAQRYTPFINIHFALTGDTFKGGEKSVMLVKKAAAAFYAGRFFYRIVSEGFADKHD